MDEDVDNLMENIFGVAEEDLYSSNESVHGSPDGSVYGSGDEIEDILEEDLDND